MNSISLLFMPEWMQVACMTIQVIAIVYVIANARRWEREGAAERAASRKD